MEEVVSSLLDHERWIDIHNRALGALVKFSKRQSKLNFIFAGVLLYEVYKNSKLEKRIEELEESERRG